MKAAECQYVENAGKHADLDNNLWHIPMSDGCTDGWGTHVVTIVVCINQFFFSTTTRLALLQPLIAGG
jgi:hypothetical protein